MKTVFLFVLSLGILAHRCPNQRPSNSKTFNKLENAPISLSNKNLFKSQKGRLDIKVQANKSVHFVDSFSESDDTNSKKYTFLGRIDLLHSYIVEEMGYEVGSIIMVSKNGSKTKLWSIPYVSRDGKVAVCLSQGIETPLLPNGLQVMHLSNGEITETCNVYIKHYEPQAVKWIDNSTFIVKLQVVDKNGVKANKFDYNIYEF